MSVAREMLSAGPGCAVANGMLNSFELTKVKLQLLQRQQQQQQRQHPPHRQLQEHHRWRHTNHPVYRHPTMYGIMRQIGTEEGIVRGLMLPGLSASLTRSMLYGAYRVGLYSTARDFLASGQKGTDTLSHRIASGMFTGGLGSALSCPLDVVRTRMQADSGLVGAGAGNQHGRRTYLTGLRRGLPVRYDGMAHCLLTIAKEEGLRHGLYRGASVTVARASLLNGSQLASYDTLKRHVVSSRRRRRREDGQGADGKEQQEGPLLHACCALASGIIAQTVVMPFDTIKSHMMLGKTWPDVWATIRAAGGGGGGLGMMRSVAWFYRGYAPACAGQGLIMVLQMPLIEQFRKLLGISTI